MKDTHNIQMHLQYYVPWLIFFLTSPIASEVIDSVMSLLKTFSKGTVQYSTEVQDSKNLLTEYDFIIIGAGTAGCVLANRLTEVSNWKVLLVEAGDDENFLMDIPMTTVYNQFTPANWKYKTESSNKYCTGLMNKQCLWPRGKVLGGSSVLNFMIYTRGAQYDYENWKVLGNDGWGWEDVLPYFKKVENFNIPEFYNQEYHNKNGSVNIEYAPFQTEMSKAWIKAAAEFGFMNVDHNGANSSGVGRVQLSMKEGTRYSANRAYLYPVQDRLNLHVTKNSRATKLLIDDKNTVIGIEVEKNNKKFEILAKKEVIVSAGVINSPQLLMLSGIGPKDHLESMKIKVVKNLSVGNNLMDHIATGGVHFLINSQGFSLDYGLNHLELMSEYMKHHKGPLSVPGGCEALVYMDLKDKFNSSLRPDIELLFISNGLNSDPLMKQVFGFDEKTYTETYSQLGKSSAFMVMPTLTQPKSKGKVLLQGRSPTLPPKIIPNYLDHEDDVKKIIESIKIAIEISKQPSMKKLGAKLYDVPIKECLKEGSFGSDSYLTCQTKMFTFTLYHPSGTCKMGIESDPTAVVDPRLRVHGIKNIRVVDASIIPEAISMHINAAVYMIAEKASDMIKQDYNSL